VPAAIENVTPLNGWLGLACGCRPLLNLNYFDSCPCLLIHLSSFHHVSGRWKQEIVCPLDTPLAINKHFIFLTTDVASKLLIGNVSDSLAHQQQTAWDVTVTDG